jgi:putative DNA primase/helicase
MPSFVVARALDVPTESQGQIPHRPTDAPHIAGRDIMNAAQIAMALGATQRSGQWWRCICPVHGSRTGHSATLALRDGDRGLIVYCHAGCRPAGILVELRRCGLLDRGFDGRGTTPYAIDCRNRQRHLEIASRIWAAGWSARGTHVVQYLAGREIDSEPPPVLRWAPRCWHRDARAALPAMIARVDGPDGDLVGVHRTYLWRDERGQWQRRDRASLGPIAGGAVRLAPAAETLLIGEGIETTLSAMFATGLPGWAALSTAGLTSLVLPPCVHAVVILADNDRNGAGTRAAHAAARRWTGEGRLVRIAMPPEPGADFNDVLAGRAYPGNLELNDVAA